MSRKGAIKESLLMEFEKYKKSYPNAQLDIECNKSLGSLMNQIFERISIEGRFSEKQPQYATLRKHLADYMLLLDGFDIKSVASTDDAQKHTD